MRRRRALFASTLAFSLAFGASAAQAAANDSAQAAAGYLAQLIGGLVVVIAVILVLAWVFRRLPGVPGQGPQVIEILAVRSVGARERLMLVQVGEEQILIGMTPAGMRPLHRLRKRVDVPAPAQGPPDFASLLKRVRTKGTET